MFATTAAQSTEHLVSGRVVMAITNTESGYAAAKAGANTAPIFSQSIRSWDVLAILKGSKNIEAAQAFLNYVAKPEVQGRLSELAPVGWTTIDTVPKLDPLVRNLTAIAHLREEMTRRSSKGYDSLRPQQRQFGLGSGRSRSPALPGIQAGEQLRGDDPLHPHLDPLDAFEAEEPLDQVRRRVRAGLADHGRQDLPHVLAEVDALDRQV